MATPKQSPFAGTVQLGTLYHPPCSFLQKYWWTGDGATVPTNRQAITITVSPSFKRHHVYAFQDITPLGWATRYWCLADLEMSLAGRALGSMPMSVGQAIYDAAPAKVITQDIVSVFTMGTGANDCLLFSPYQVASGGQGPFALQPQVLTGEIDTFNVNVRECYNIGYARIFLAVLSFPN